MNPTTVDLIEVLWPPENTHFPGIVESVNGEKYSILHDDGDLEVFSLAEQVWRSFTSLSSAIIPGMKIKSIEQVILSNILETFGNKSSLQHYAQRFLQAIVVKY